MRDVYVDLRYGDHKRHELSPFDVLEAQQRKPNTGSYLITKLTYFHHLDFSRLLVCYSGIHS